MTKIESLLIIHKHPKILLGRVVVRDGKIGGGKWNGFGGKFDPEQDSDIEACMKRELFEEGGITVDNHEKVGEILFHFEINEPDHHVHIFRATDFNGELKTSTEMREYQWFRHNELPEKMWVADKHWIPFLVNGKKFKGEVFFDKEFKNPKVNIYEVESL